MSQPTEPATLSSTEVQTHFGAIIRRVVKDGEHLVVERGGLPVMVILPLGDYQELIAERKGGEDDGHHRQTA